MAVLQTDAQFVVERAVPGIAGLPVQLRNPSTSGVETSNGPFMALRLQVGGVLI